MKKIFFKPMTWIPQVTDPADGIIRREIGRFGMHERAELTEHNAAPLTVTVSKCVRRHDIVAHMGLDGGLNDLARSLAEAAYALLDLANAQATGQTLFCDYLDRAETLKTVVAEPLIWGDGGPAAHKRGRLTEYGYSGRTPIAQAYYEPNGDARLAIRTKRRGAELGMSVAISGHPCLIRAMASPLYRYLRLAIEEADRPPRRKPRRRIEAEEREIAMPVPAPPSGLTDFIPDPDPVVIA